MPGKGCCGSVKEGVIEVEMACKNAGRGRESVGGCLRCRG